ncbi:MAG: thiamine phosphate synthase [Bacteroidales bacterium]|nr:thiamine phosphate synthase [Bacteroidales bacterium]MBD5253878.1 thiamine phosphate synthase [Barnesiella sp.]MBD5345163.1 thiamine phosphate synthase [Bacteroides sp.]
MLQFITHPSEKYSIAEEVQMVIEGGCRWVQLRLKDVSDEEFVQIAEEVIPLCRESNTFLVFDDRVELAVKMHVHGVHLGKNDMPPAQARELMGAEAIIGCTANTAADITALSGIDVDYVGLGPYRHTTTKERLSPILGLEGYRKVVAEASAAGNKLPIVAIGGITIDDIEPILATGVNGIAMSGAIINAPDPVEYTRRVMTLLTEINPRIAQ